jgi:polyketide biosynthesis enoyl-CoA hydratase PksI
MSGRPFETTARGDGVMSMRIVTDADPWIGPAWVDAFLAALTRIAEDASVRALVLEGGEPYFCAGASRDALLDAANAAGPASYIATVPHALLALPVPIVAAMAGHAVGGGLVLGLWCDAAVLAEEGLYGANFMALGFTPGMGATHVVPEAFGAPLGRELLQTGRLLTGREIRATGCPLAHAVCPKTRVFEHALTIAGEMTAAPRDAALLLKRDLAAHRREDLERALRAEQISHARLFAGSATRDEIARRYRSAGTPERSGSP